jgi:hypothetical protein
MIISSNDYRRDSEGQWWYYSPRGTRSRVYEQTCQKCEKAFISRHKQMFCSATCRSASQKGVARTNKIATCGNCGKDFTRPMRSNRKKCCSQSCANKLGNSKRGSPGPKNGNWKGGKKNHAAGYVLQWVKGRGHLLEHRLVMEKLMGRRLERYEEVHHKNGIRHDNRPENLELWVKRQPGGQRAKDLLEHARWILETYGPLEVNLQ